MTHWRLERVIRGAYDLVARVNPQPVLVLGNQKSGTTAVAALLAKVSGVSVALDFDKEIGDPTYQKVVSGEHSLKRFIRRNRWEFSRTIVKEPNLLTIWQPLLAELPAARTLLVVRDPRDNIRSILDRLGLPGDREQLTREELHRHGRGWTLYLDGGWLGLAADNYIEVMAQRWNLAHEFLKVNAGDAVVVRYEDFVRDKETVLAEVADRLGLPCAHRLGADGDRQYQPRGRGDRSWREVFGDRNLARIERTCAEGMRVFGYEPAG